MKTQPNEERAKILLYARTRYMKEGFYKTSMNTLASEMQMSKKTIYKHFPTKEKLVEEVVMDFMNFVRGRIEEIFNTRKDAVAKIAGFTELLGVLSSQISENWLKDMRLHMPELWAKVDAFRTRKMNTEITNLIAQGKKEKLFLDYPGEIIVTIFVASIRAIVNPDFLLNNKFSYNQAARISIEIILNGILTEKGKKIFYKSFNRTEK
ncbi:MAG: TetR/AcrR family transcriptional regulator [Ignavibacteriaceae bacterium]